MNKNTGLIIGIVVLILIGGYFLWASQDTRTELDQNVDSSNEQNGNPAQGSENTSPTGGSPSPDTPTSSDVPGTEEFMVSASNFEFSVNEIRVQKGTKVRIVFRNDEGRHDWRLDEFGAMTNVLSEGEEQTVEFVANKTGQFEFYCSVGTHRAMGMKGVFTVDD